jgi:hypothetical protein
MQNLPPEDWNDKTGWDRFFAAEADNSLPATASFCASLRYIEFARERGGRTWFPGCGIDPGPRAYAAVGCTVLATDISAFAVQWQNGIASRPPRECFADWQNFLMQNALTEEAGQFSCVEHDFLQAPPDETFDTVINCRAFQGLPPESMKLAAGNFFAALRPGGAAIFDTANVQGNDRNILEDALAGAGFYLPYAKSERWYRDQLDGTGIVHVMVLGHPRIPSWNQYPASHFNAFKKRHSETLESFRAEYEARREAEAVDVEAAQNDPAVIVAHVVYSTG